MSALFMVQGQDLRQSPCLIGEYDILVVNAELDYQAVRAKAKKDAKLLAYLGSHMVPKYGTDQSIHGQLRTRTGDHWSPERVNSYGDYELDPTLAAYDALCRVISDTFTYEEFDGVYIDDLWGEPPTEWANLHGIAHQPDARVLWASLAHYLVERLRADGVPPVIVGNVGGYPVGVRHLGLDGITIEDYHVRKMGPAVAMAHWAQYPASLNVWWGCDPPIPGGRQGVVHQGIIPRRDEAGDLIPGQFGMPKEGS